MTTGTNLTVKARVHFTQARRGGKKMVVGETPAAIETPTGRVPRISRLMALAIRFEGLLQRGEVRDYAELALVGHVTRARVTQIMNLLNLAPDIQEEILFLPAVEAGRDPVKEWEVRPVSAEALWAKQRLRWRAAVRRG
jgi:hypothetical protein